MASAPPSTGFGDPAPCFGVRGLSGRALLGLAPGSEIGGRVGVAVSDEATVLTAKDPMGQGHLLPDPPARRAGLGGGEKRGATTKVAPYHSALYRSWLPSSPQAASLMDRARWWFFTMFFTARSSMQMAPWVLAIWLESRWVKSWRRLATRPWRRPRRARALARLAEPGTLRETDRDDRAIAGPAVTRWRGGSMRPHSDRSEPANTRSPRRSGTQRLPSVSMRSTS